VHRSGGVQNPVPVRPRSKRGPGATAGETGAVRPGAGNETNEATTSAAAKTTFLSIGILLRGFFEPRSADEQARSHLGPQSPAPSSHWKNYDRRPTRRPSPPSAHFSFEAERREDAARAGSSGECPDGTLLLGASLVNRLSWGRAGVRTTAQSRCRGGSRGAQAGVRARVSKLKRHLHSSSIEPIARYRSAEPRRLS
jgi:hypothetical protein